MCRLNSRLDIAKEVIGEVEDKSEEMQHKETKTYKIFLMSKYIDDRVKRVNIYLIVLPEK